MDPGLVTLSRPGKTKTVGSNCCSLDTNFPVAGDLPVVPTCRRPFACDVGQITSILSRIPRPHEGRFAIVTDVGCGMRWTLWRCKTSDAETDGEVVWS